jgi:hypothetical protein
MSSPTPDEPGYEEYLNAFGKRIQLMLTQKEYRRLKTRLTRRLNDFNDKARWGNNDRREMAARVYEEAVYGLDIFVDRGYPDNWHRWERAKEDAAYWIAYEDAR